ncbi:MAG: SinI family restriction endonuclease [Phormidesmis sp.]
MTKFNEELVRKLAFDIADSDDKNEQKIAEGFVEICRFISENPKQLSWPTKKKPADIYASETLEALSKKHFKGYRKSDLPGQPGTIPDQMVSVVMNVAYDYSFEQCENIKKEHQYAMLAENCVGSLLERYIDSVARADGWYWCCGNFVSAIDFVKKDSDGNWIALQIKNRSNSENSSSKTVRDGTTIEIWYRSYSKKPKTNWDKLPLSMRGYGLSEESFISFTKDYLCSQTGLKQR